MTYFEDWRVQLVRRYPRLFPDARVVNLGQGPTVSCSGWPGVSDGWRRVLEVACSRLDAAVRTQGSGGVTVQEVKEKFGSLRLRVCEQGLGAEARAAVDLAVELAEARSAFVCDQCGAAGCLRDDDGWFVTRCDEHGEGALPVRDRNAGIQLVTRYVEGEPETSARRYDFETDSFVPAALPQPED